MITGVTIRNFKSIVDTSIDFDPLTVLVGRSGSGKTNVIDALRLVRDYLKSRDSYLNRLNSQGDFRRIQCATRIGAPTSVEIRFRSSAFPDEFKYQISLSQHRHNYIGYLSHEQLSLGPKIMFSQSNDATSPRWDTTPPMVSPPAPGNLVLGLLHGIPAAQVAYLTIARGLGCYDFPGNVLATKVPDHPSEQSTTLDDVASNFVQIFDTIFSNVADLSASQEIIAALRKLNSNLQSLELDPTTKNRIVVGHQQGTAPALNFDLAQQSEGFRRFLAHLLALYQVPARATLVFEEPEKGIYPAALAALADYFIHFSGRGISQIVLTTHNPVLLDHFPVDSIRVVEMRNLETKVGRVSQEQISAVKDSLMMTGELLTVDPARIDESTPITETR